MDYAAAIERVYEHAEDGHVDRAVMGCLRIARHLGDHLNAAIFFRELYPSNRELFRSLLEDTSSLTSEAQKFLYERSSERWLDRHTLDFPLVSDGGEPRKVVTLGVGELDAEVAQLERSIQDMTIPSGMGEYDTAAFTDRYISQKAKIRLRIQAVQTVKERIRAFCVNYAIGVERQLDAQRKVQSFLDKAQNEVNNYFKAHSEDVHTKLQKASELVDSESPEDLSLLLTEVRRAIKSAADFFYPPSDQPVRCSDGKVRVVGNDEYLNRLQEFLATRFKKSSSRDLLRAELGHLALFARRLDAVASKGVHDEVSTSEAKQGVLGLYLFLYNVCSRLQEKPS